MKVNNPFYKSFYNPVSYQTIINFIYQLICEFLFYALLDGHRLYDSYLHMPVSL